MPVYGYDVHAVAYSDVGRVREGNEDAFCVADLTERIEIESNGILEFSSGPGGALFAVADGMGGAAAGETASRVCIQTLYAEVVARMSSARAAQLQTVGQILIEAVGLANQRVYDLSCQDQAFSGMGTTLTAVIELEGKLTIGQVGDSRAYLISREGIRRLTKDQSLVAQLLDAGQITEEQAQRHPERNFLLQAVGVQESVELALEEISVDPQDFILLCSDGLHSQVTANEIYSIVTGVDSPRQACLELIDAANHCGGPDNITAIVVQFRERSRV